MPLQILTARLPDGRQELRGVFWCHDHQVIAFRRNPTVINLDNTGVCRGSQQSCSYVIRCEWKTHARTTLLFSSPSPAKTNNKAMPLLQIVGVDGNLSTFPIGFAVMYDETIESFQWVFSHFVEVYGKDACEAVHMVMGDEDHGQNGAFERVKQVIKDCHKWGLFTVAVLCVLCYHYCIAVATTIKDVILPFIIQAAFPNAVLLGCTWHLALNINKALHGKGATTEVVEHIQKTIKRLHYEVCMCVMYLWVAQYLMSLFRARGDGWFQCPCADNGAPFSPCVHVNELFSAAASREPLVCRLRTRRPPRRVGTEMWLTTLTTTRLFQTRPRRLSSCTSRYETCLWLDRSFCTHQSSRTCDAITFT